MLKRILRWTASGLVMVAVLIAVVYLRDMNRIYERIEGKSAVIASPYGDIEYTESGTGSEVLVIRGSGGGYDQGELIADAVLDKQFRRITPSRFGYLQSTFRDHATWDDQAHAYAYLLDHLGIEKVAVVAMSHGGPSALLFALLHPERISSLTLISCGVASVSSEEQLQANQKGDMLTTIYRYDLLYWLISKLFKKQFMELIGANETVIAGFTSSQLELVERFIDGMNPVSLRSSGVAFDNKAPLPGDRIAGIKAPTLIIHAKDDELQLYHNAEFAESTIPDAKLIHFEKGGHLVISVEQSAIRAIVQRHIFDNMNRYPMSGSRQPD